MGNLITSEAQLMDDLAKATNDSPSVCHDGEEIDEWIDLTDDDDDDSIEEDEEVEVEDDQGMSHSYVSLHFPPFLYLFNATDTSFLKILKKGF